MGQVKSGYLMLFSSFMVVLTLILATTLILRALSASQRQACGTLKALIEVYEETPPATETGRNVERAYREQYNLYHCQER